MFDERYAGGGYEDYDFTVRLKEANLATYISEEVPYINGPSRWDYISTFPFWQQKWRHEWKDFSGGIPSRLVRTLPEEKYNYKLGASAPTKFLPSSFNFTTSWRHVGVFFDVTIASTL